MYCDNIEYEIRNTYLTILTYNDDEYLLVHQHWTFCA